MAAPKKPTSTRRTTANKPQAFDIIPRSQVKPSASGRPVITATSPEQTDNTLLQSSASAVETSQLSHQPLKLQPTGDVTTKDTAVSASPAADLGRRLAGSGKADDEKAAAADSSGTKLDDIPTAPVVPGADPDAIKAKLSKRAAAERAEKEAPKEPEDDEETEVVADEAKEAVTGKPEPAEPAESQVTDDAKADTKDDAKDVPEDTEPKPGSDTPDAGTDADKSPHEDAPKDDAARQSVDQPLPLKGDLPGDAGKEGEDGEEGNDGKPSDERPRHELYGGKPVIVIHKHSKHSALKAILWIILCLILAVAIVDVLLDAGVITTNYDVPYTDFL